MASMGRRVHSLVWCAALIGCSGPGETAFVRSCRGERYLECDPHEYAVVREAVLTPARIAPLDPAARGRVHVVLDACPMRPGPAEVQLGALLESDAGDPVRFVDLGIVVRDDGTGADATANDGTIDADIGNPFGREIPGNTTIRLRFVPVVAGCDGEALEIAYTTGPRASPLNPTLPR